MPYKIGQKRHSAKWDRCVKKVGKKGGTNPYAVCSASLGKESWATEPKTKGEAQTMAIEYQHWASNRNLSYGELVEYQNYFTKLGKKFGLTREFKENGII